jgi:alkylated DNA repair dioxygenase AlkB
MPVPGLRYVPGYLQPDAHDDLLVAVDEQPWQQPSYIGRRVQVYGYTYNHTRGGIFKIGDLPGWVGDLAGRLVRDGLMPAVPDQMIVNEYPPGTGIPAHVDTDAFDDSIVSVSLGSSCVMDLMRPGVSQTEAVFLEPRSALLLSGEARQRWMHAIPARLADDWEGVERPRGRRVSLTFRTMVPGRIIA